MIDYRFNNDQSPVRQDPYVGFGVDQSGNEWQLGLAINTDQYGRTFQDRSFMFYISQRPDGISADHRIINLNVRGKRGNIVETYPAVEYDFTPGDLYVTVGDYVHFQWTGCNTNPNYAGEGTQGTDRSNMVQLVDGRMNYPISFDSQTLFDTSGQAFEMAYLNQYGGAVCQTTSQQSCCRTVTQLQAENNPDQDAQNCAKLNGPVQYYDAGPVRMTKTGTYYYMSTRNNDFTNRSQKGILNIDSLLPTWGIVMASAGAVGFAGASTLAGLTYYAQTHPQAAIANVFANCKL
jgi:plastocyanin